MRNMLYITALCFVLTACSLTPDYTRPSLELSENWQHADAVVQSEQDTQAAIAAEWWGAFNDAELSRLIEQALAQNYTVEAGVQRIEQARAALKIAGASLLPSVNVSAGSSATYLDTNSKNYSAGLNASYELDLFGANRAGISSAEADLQASQFDQESLRLALMGDVAQGYFTLLTLQERLQIAENNLANAREILRIIDARVNRGSESELQLAQQQSTVASSEAARDQLTQQLQNARHALAVLTGTTPTALDISPSSLRSIAIPAITPVQPASLLERRPDIRSAEASLLAANANIGVARAAFYPTVSISAGASAATASLGDSTTTLLSLASSLTAPLFRGGELEGGLERATARQKELIANYRQSILTAVQEVEDALVAAQISEQREQSLRVAMEQAQKAYRLSKLRYDAGAIDFQTLLDTQSAQLSTEDSFSQARQTRLNAAVDLFMVLGGGWSSIDQP